MIGTYLHSAARKSSRGICEDDVPTMDVVSFRKERVLGCVTTDMVLGPECEDYSKIAAVAMRAAGGG